MMNEFGGHGWGMGWWWIIGFIVVVAIVWMVIKAMNKNNSTNQISDKSAHDILKERYARGEIDKKKFDERKKDLMQSVYFLNFEDAVTKVIEELRKEGFGVLSEIDIHEKLKEKLD